MRDPNCTACPLHADAETVCLWGSGPKRARVMVIGEAPGAEEDDTGTPFVGRPGKLLDKALSDLAGIDRSEVYVTNVVKCRPPQNRTPNPAEMTACEPHLHAQLALVQPRVVLLLGATAVREVLGEPYRITRCRGQWYERGGIPVIATYHPSALLRDQSKKREAWSDLKLVKQKLLEMQLYPDLLKGDE